MSRIHEMLPVLLKDAMKFVTFCRKENPDGNFIIAKIVARKSPPRRWRLS